MKLISTSIPFKIKKVASENEQLAEKSIIVLQQLKDNVVLALQGQNVLVLKYSLNKDELQKEYNLLLQNQSEYIIPCGQFFEIDSRYYFEMQFANNRDLGWYLNNYPTKSGKINQLLARRMFWQALLCVKALHDKNVLHCDIKVENLLLNTTNQIPEQQKIIEVLLCDFGSAINLDNQMQLITTNRNQPPETIEHKNPWTKASDIFQLGIVLFQLLIGVHPFSKGNDDQLYSQNIQIGVVYYYLNDDIKQVQLSELSCQIVFGEDCSDESFDSRKKVAVVRLLTLMLHKDPIKRLTVDEICSDKYYLDFFEATIVDEYKENHKQVQTRSFNLQMQNKQLQEQKFITPLSEISRTYEQLSAPIFNGSNIIIYLYERENRITEKKRRYIVEMNYIESMEHYNNLVQTSLLELKFNCTLTRNIKEIWMDQQMLFKMYCNTKNTESLKTMSENMMSHKQILSSRKRVCILLQVLMFLDYLHKMDYAYNQLEINSIILWQDKSIFNESEETTQIKMRNFNKCAKQGTLLGCLEQESQNIFMSPDEKNMYLKFICISKASNDIYALSMLAIYLCKFDQNAKEVQMQQLVQQQNPSKYNQQDDILYNEVTVIIAQCKGSYRTSTTQQLLSNTKVQQAIKQIFKPNIFSFSDESAKMKATQYNPGYQPIYKNEQQ